MASRNVAVQEVVYDALAVEKRSGESFTSLLRRLLDQRQGLADLAGSWGPEGERADRIGIRRLRSGGLSGR